MGDYIFPQKIANWMGKISQRTQYEAAMLSMVFIMAGLIFFSVFTFFFTELSMVMKIGVVVNTLAGMVFLGSFLITTYQQYRNYKDFMGLYEEGSLEKKEVSPELMDIAIKQIKESPMGFEREKKAKESLQAKVSDLAQEKAKEEIEKLDKKFKDGKEVMKIVKEINDEALEGEESLEKGE